MAKPPKGRNVQPFVLTQIFDRGYRNNRQVKSRINDVFTLKSSNVELQKLQGF